MEENLWGEEINYDYVTANIPWVMQSLYYPDIIDTIKFIEIRDAFRVHQMQGKAWLLNHTKQFDKNSKILVIGSWLGFTSYCLYKIGFKYISETDPEDRFSKLAKNINQNNKNFIHYSKDVNEIDLDQYDLIINTSCEHIANNSWFQKINQKCNVVLHSTNLKWHDHYNTVENLEEMKIKYPMNFTYAGHLKFSQSNSKTYAGYSRFMLIGQKI